MSEGTEIILQGEARENDFGSFKNAKAQSIAEFEEKYLRQVLEQCAGNLSQAARLAGQDRSAFGKLVRKYNMQSVI